MLRHEDAQNLVPAKCTHAQCGDHGAIDAAGKADDRTAPPEGGHDLPAQCFDDPLNLRSGIQQQHIIAELLLWRDTCSDVHGRASRLQYSEGV